MVCLLGSWYKILVDHGKWLSNEWKLCKYRLKLWKLFCHAKLYGHAVGGLNLESSTFQTTYCKMGEVAQGCFVDGNEHFDTLVMFEGPA
jgi:hypothetical protein